MFLPCPFNYTAAQQTNSFRFPRLGPSMVKVAQVQLSWTHRRGDTRQWRLWWSGWTEARSKWKCVGLGCRTFLWVTKWHDTLLLFISIFSGLRRRSLVPHRLKEICAREERRFFFFFHLLNIKHSITWWLLLRTIKGDGTVHKRWLSWPGRGDAAVCKRVVERKSEEPRFDGSLQKKWLTQFCTFVVVGQASRRRSRSTRKRGTQLSRWSVHVISGLTI